VRRRRCWQAPPVTPTEEIRAIADELRALAAMGLRFTQDDPYNRERYERVRSTAARLFAVADVRSPSEIERSLLTQLTHVTPATCGDAAVFDDGGRILLIQRADDGLWAMPGGAFDVGETAAEGVAREAREEAGVEVEVTDLIGVWDSRFCETRSSIQLFQFVFLCRPKRSMEASTPHEVLDVRWFDRAALPDLSPGHTVRVPYAFEFLSHRRSYFDPPHAAE
jgi:8-oxo-dGTP pyrophosphatase MutT (NUDIX family)